MMVLANDVLVVFTERMIHVQYIMASSNGRERKQPAGSTCVYVVS